MSKGRFRLNTTITINGNGVWDGRLDRNLDAVERQMNSSDHITYGFWFVLGYKLKSSHCWALCILLNMQNAVFSLLNLWRHNVRCHFHCHSMQIHTKQLHRHHIDLEFKFLTFYMQIPMLCYFVCFLATSSDTPTNEPFCPKTSLVSNWI